MIWRGGAVHLRNASKSFGDYAAVSDFSLSVDEGEFVSLLGPSGCGKSTILRIIAGFETAGHGSVWFDGKDYTDIPAHLRPVNMVFQSYALFPHMTILDNVAFGLRRKKVPEAEVVPLVHKFLDMVRLGEFSKRYPTQLSGGQQQRVALARALVNRPKVLLLDEPLAALDLKLRKSMRVELKLLQRELGISFIYVTHDQDEALALSDKIGVISGGRLLQYGTARDVYDRPSTDFVANFLGEANILRCSVRSKGGSVVLEIPEGIVQHSLTGETLLTGTSAMFAIRPEDIVVSSTRPPRDNVYACLVENKVFSGTAPTIFVRGAGGTTLSVCSADRATFDALDVGQHAFVGWQASQGVIVAETRIAQGMFHNNLHI